RLLQGHAVAVVDALANGIVLPQVGAAGERAVPAPAVEVGRNDQILWRDARFHLGHERLGRRGFRIALAYQDPALEFQHRRAVLAGAAGMDIDDAALAGGGLLEADDAAFGGKGVAW